MKLKVALVQFARRESFKENIKRMQEILSDVKGVEIVCLPEAWVGKALILEPKDVNIIILSLGKIAKQNNINILLGGFFGVAGFTDKLFPSMAVGERVFSDFGETLNILTVDNTRFGVVVCVDAIYPEIVRKLSLKGAKVIFNPGNIPENRIKLWEHVGVTRAAENTIYYVFVNNTYTTYPDGRKVMGKSFVASPYGEIIFQADESENVFQVELDHWKT
jgi:predicted amidohydrolase